jgi:hypothetical protein
MGIDSMKNSSVVGQRLLARTLDWPRSWHGEEIDIPAGIGILKVFTPFLQHLVDSGFAPTTLHRHFSNIWLLGGEIIRQSSYDSELRSLPGDDLVLRFIDEEGGPLSRHNHTESEKRSFDSSCRKLYQFLLTKKQESQ